MNDRLAVRRALRASLADIAGVGSLVLIACSGGPDSLALALAAGDEMRARGGSSDSDSAAPSGPVRFGAIVIDHGLQAGSAEVAARAAEACREAGLDPVEVIRVQVSSGADGPEAAARRARRTALSDAAARLGAVAVLLAHTRDDQAETVLLRLARGSGARSLSGMAPVAGLWRRPLLELPRSVVHASLQGTLAWADPHNVDPAYARSRVRADGLPALVETLGPDVVDGLARSASLLRDDADALDAWADAVWPTVVLTEVRASAPPMPTKTPELIGIDGAQLNSLSGAASPARQRAIVLDVVALASLPRAVRTRLLRRAAIEAGCGAGAVTREHILRAEALVSDWRGQGAADLPGRVSVSRAYGRLEFRSTPQPSEE